MPEELQRVMNATFSEFPQARAFLDDILVLNKRSKTEHISAVEKILRKLDKKNMSLEPNKSKFAQSQCEWLGHIPRILILK